LVRWEKDGAAVVRHESGGWGVLPGCGPSSGSYPVPLALLTPPEPRGRPAPTFSHVSTVRYPARPQQSLMLSNKAIDDLNSCSPFRHILLALPVSPGGHERGDGRRQLGKNAGNID